MRERIASRWAHASTRERALIVLAGMALAAGIGWPMLWQPLEREGARIDTAREDARARTLAARAMADEIAALARAPQPGIATDPRAAVERVLAARGLRSALTALDIDGARARVTFATVELDALARFVEALARDERLFVVEALLAASVVPGSVRAELTLARPADR